LFTNPSGLAPAFLPKGKKPHFSTSIKSKDFISLNLLNAKGSKSIPLCISKETKLSSSLRPKTISQAFSKA